MKNTEGQTSLRVIQVSKKPTETHLKSHSSHEQSRLPQGLVVLTYLSTESTSEVKSMALCLDTIANRDLNYRAHGLDIHYYQIH